MQNVFKYTDIRNVKEGFDLGRKMCDTKGKKRDEDQDEDDSEYQDDDDCYEDIESSTCW